MYIEFMLQNGNCSYIDLEEKEVAAIIDLLNINNVTLDGEIFSYALEFEEILSISKSLEEVGILLAIEKEYEYEVVLSKETFEHTEVILRLAEYFERLLRLNVITAKLYISNENLALPQALKLKRLKAVKKQQAVNNIVANGYYQHSLTLPYSVESDFFEKIDFSPVWGITYVDSREYFTKKGYIPLKGYEVCIETTTKIYFTGACEVTLSEYHIYRNQKDHRYSYKIKRAQKISRYLIDEEIIREVDDSTESDYEKRIEDAQNFLEIIGQKAEQNILKLYKLNDSIVKPFVKNTEYYSERLTMVEQFVNDDYSALIETYFLLGIITSREYEFYQYLKNRIYAILKDIEILQELNDRDGVLSKQALVLRYFLENTDVYPKAGLIRHNKGVYRSLMQIEQERCYSKDFRSDDTLKEYYKNSNL